MEITEINNTKENITDVPKSGNVGSNNTTSTSDEVGVSYKYVASIDVGIKNLALCIFQINVSSDSSFPFRDYWQRVSTGQVWTQSYCRFWRLQLVCDLSNQRLSYSHW